VKNKQRKLLLASVNMFRQEIFPQTNLHYKDLTAEAGCRGQTTSVTANLGQNVRLSSGATRPVFSLSLSSSFPLGFHPNGKIQAKVGTLQFGRGEQ